MYAHSSSSDARSARRPSLECPADDPAGSGYFLVLMLQHIIIMYAYDLRSYIYMNK